VASKNYLSVSHLFQNISDNYDYNNLEYIQKDIFDFFQYLEINKFIYNNSKISVSDFYKSCCFISYKTSNNQHEIEKMPFYVFNNFNIYLNDILKAENKGSGDSENTSPEDQFNKMQSSAKSNFKSMSSNFKMPKMK
jgi:hypothetical protein